MLQLDHWLLPEGVEEVLPDDAVRLESLRRTLLDLFSTWGYELVIPPLIEFLESLLTGVGHDLDLQTFKLTDQLSGRMLGIRADMTPQVARIDAHNLKRDIPTRLCYVGTVLHTRGDHLERSRSPMQVGAELYGHAGMASDLEILRLMLETLAMAGLQKVHVDLGHVGIFRGLARQAGLNSDQEAQVFNVLQRKARPELVELLSELDLTAEMRAMLSVLPELNGYAGVIELARQRLTSADRSVMQALEDLEQIARQLSRAFPSLPINFDLSELRGYRYQTGMVFAAFVPGHGREIARGGRYDEVGKVFGRARPATGFSADLKVLARLASEMEGSTGCVQSIFAPSIDDADLGEKIRDLRAAGRHVIQELAGQTGNAADMGCTHKLDKRGREWEIVPV
jgi:ATP phosphoribosyltransferase regulatory subunit